MHLFSKIFVCAPSKKFFLAPALVQLLPNFFLATPLVGGICPSHRTNLSDAHLPFDGVRLVNTSLEFDCWFLAGGVKEHYFQFANTVCNKMPKGRNV